MAAEPAAKDAARLFQATMVFTVVGIFIGIALFFIDIDLSVRFAAAVLAGIVGFISFLRHSVYYKSDQARMGWHQDHPEFQLEVGYANLAVGIWALVVAILDWGAEACGLVLAIYGTYLLCALLLHAKEAFGRNDLAHPAERQRAVRSVISTGFFVIFLYGFALIAFARAGLVPFVQP